MSAGSIGREKTLQEGIGWVSAYENEALAQFF
jgi:hypothetical protein